jgi:hypothetical protein
VELYLARGEERPAIQVACAGTLVADDIAELSAIDIAHAPWVGRELTGLFDFADFQIPPGSRRGVVTDAAAHAFADALARLRPIVLQRLTELDQARRESVDRNVIRELRRALRGFRRRLPHYDLPRIEGRDEPDGASRPGEGVGEGEPPEATERGPQIELLPPGPLAEVRIVPAELVLAPGAERRVRAVALDASRRPCTGVDLVWSVLDDAGAGLEIHGTGPRPALRARPDAPIGRRAQLGVEATQDSIVVRATAIVRIEESEEHDASLGIPEPQLVSDPRGSWRSRLAGETWEVNDAHEDYLALRDNPRSRLRYLLALLAKEIVLRSTGRTDAIDVMESLVEVLAHAERNLTRGE